MQGLEKLGGIGHLWHALRVDKGGHLDLAQTRLGQRVHQGHAVRNRKSGRLDLKALARAFLMNLDALG